MFYTPSNRIKLFRAVQAIWDFLQEVLQLQARHGGSMNTKKVWFITGAGRGMGVDIAKAALAAGHRVVATGRNTGKVAGALGKSGNLLIVRLDITQPAEAASATKAAVDKFGRIDVLVNNAANFYAGFFEELTPDQMERQLSTSLT